MMFHRKKLKNWTCICSLIVLHTFVLAYFAQHSMAQGLVVYPAKDQSASQQQADEGQCMQWAKQQSGFDPTLPPPSPSGGPSTAGGAVKGGALGAGMGAVGGAIAGSAGKGAAIGAASGALIGGVMSRREAKKQEESYQNANQVYANKRSTYERAYSACLQGRGYTVK